MKIELFGISVADLVAYPIAWWCKGKRKEEIKQLLETYDSYFIGKYGKRIDFDYDILPTKDGIEKRGKKNYINLPFKDMVLGLRNETKANIFRKSFRNTITRDFLAADDLVDAWTWAETLYYFGLKNEDIISVIKDSDDYKEFLKTENEQFNDIAKVVRKRGEAAKLYEELSNLMQDIDESEKAMPITGKKLVKKKEEFMHEFYTKYPEELDIQVK